MAEAVVACSSPIRRRYEELRHDPRSSRQLWPRARRRRRPPRGRRLRRCSSAWASPPSPLARTSSPSERVIDSVQCRRDLSLALSRIGDLCRGMPGRDEAYLRIGELSRRTGVSRELLRAWERRYGLLQPQRTPGGFRLYTDRDLARVNARCRRSSRTACRPPRRPASRSSSRRGPRPASPPCGPALSAAIDELMEVAARLRRAESRGPPRPARRRILDGRRSCRRCSSPSSGSSASARASGTSRSRRSTSRPT